MAKQIGNILFIVAGILWTIEFIPQLIKILRTKSVQDISLLFLILCLIAYIIFIVGCLLIKNWFLFFSHFIPFVNVLIVFILVLKYRKS